MLRQGIYAPLRVLVFGVRCGPAGVAVDTRGFRVRPVPSELWRGRLSPVWSVAWWLVFCAWGGGRLLPFSLLRDSQSGVRRGVGAVRSDIRVPEAKRGRVPL